MAQVSLESSCVWFLLTTVEVMTHDIYLKHFITLCILFVFLETYLIFYEKHSNIKWFLHKVCKKILIYGDYWVFTHNFYSYTFQANKSSEPIDIFDFLYSHGMGNQVAALFLTWAATLEVMGNTTKADAIYQRGIELGAQPLLLLRKRHR